MIIRITKSGEECTNGKLVSGQLIDAEPVETGLYSGEGVFIEDRTAILLTGEYEIVE